MSATMVQLSSVTPNSTTSTGVNKFPPLPSTAQSRHTNYHEREFSFPGKSRFQAGQDLLVTRSDSYTIRKQHPVDDIWRRPPPNFCPQSYAAKPPKRNSRESMKPWKYGTYPGHKTQVKREQAVTLPKALQPQRQKSAKLVNRFKVMDSFEAKCEFVREGMYRKEQYKNPMPHDFRQYPPLGPLGLPEFETSSNHDPYNIHFKSNNLDTIHGMRPVSPGHRFRGRQMGQSMEGQPNYEPDLILPRGKWPTPGEEFTRHRQRNRSPHAALLGRIEDTLNKQWQQEKAEKERRQKEQEQEEKERKFREDIQRKLDDHAAQEWRRTGPGGWSARSSQYQGRDRDRVNDIYDIYGSSGSSTLQTLSDGSSDFS